MTAHQPASAREPVTSREHEAAPDHEAAAALDLRAFLAQTSRIAVVGLSSRPHRPSHGVARRLLVLGFDVIPVNPFETEVLGRPAVGSLYHLDGPVDIVNVFRRPEHAPQIAQDTVAIGAPLLWLQSGITSQAARHIASDAGIAYVENRCLGVEAGWLLDTGA